MRFYLPIAILAFLTAGFNASVLAQSKALVQISGGNSGPLILTIAQVKALPHTTITIKGHDEKMHTYSGVLISTLLNKAGIPLGDAAKKQTAGSYLLIKAADQYITVYALAEADSMFTDKKIILADQQDGTILPDRIGPFQIISTGEKIHGRMIRQVVSIAVVKA